MEGLENSTAQRETRVVNSLMQLLNTLLSRNRELCFQLLSFLFFTLFSFRSLASSYHLSNLCLASSTTNLPPHHHLFQSLCNFLHLSFFTGLLLCLFLLLCLAVSLWEGFSVGTGSGSAGSCRTVAHRLFFFLREGVERSRRPLLLVLELKLG